MDKKRRSFGSFFGPSEPVVARRIIEEARARDEAKQAKLALEAEQRKLAKSSTGGKKISSGGNPGTSSGKASLKKAPKPVNKDTEKARKLKEARDFKFLLDDSPLPNQKKEVGKELASSKSDSRPDTSRSASVRSSNGVLKKSPLGGAKSSDRPIASKPLPSRPKFLPTSRSLPKQSPHRHSASDRYVAQSKHKSPAMDRGPPSKEFSARPSRSDSRKEATLKDDAVLRKLVAGPIASNGNKAVKSGRHSLPSQAMDKRNSESLDKLPASTKVDRSLPESTDKRAHQSKDKKPGQAPDRRPSQASGGGPAHAPDKRSAQTPDRRLAQASDRRPAQTPDRRPVQTPDKRSTHAPDKRPAQSQDRRPAQGKEKRPAQAPDRQSSKATDRRPAVSPGLKKEASASATHRSAVAEAEPRQRMASQSGRQTLQTKSVAKGASRPASSNHNRENYGGARVGSLEKKRVRSSSEDSEEQPRYKKGKPGRVVSRGRRSPSEDSFIDDDDDQPNISSVISKLFRGYNRNRYQDEDDSDECMEVGFNQIQVEERISAREARLEDEEQQKLIEAEEREERLRKAKKKRKQGAR